MHFIRRLYTAAGNREVTLIAAVLEHAGITGTNWQPIIGCQCNIAAIKVNRRATPPIPRAFRPTLIAAARRFSRAL
ncbi:MAG: hypothetical protein ACHP82_11730 [Hyphomicrobiales bacterium]